MIDSALMRVYDEALATKLGAADSPPLKYRVATVAGIDLPVPMLSGTPEEWAKSYSLPGIAIARIAEVPAPMRLLPGFRLELPVGATYEIQSVPSVPVDLMYQLSLEATTMSEHNALVSHVLSKLPAIGYGTVVTIFGHPMPFRLAHVQKRREYLDDVQKGRRISQEFTYVLEGWLVDASCDIIKQILYTDIVFEDQRTGDILA